MLIKNYKSTSCYEIKLQCLNPCDIYVIDIYKILAELGLCFENVGVHTAEFFPVYTTKYITYILKKNVQVYYSNLFNKRTDHRINKETYHSSKPTSMKRRIMT